MGGRDTYRRSSYAISDYLRSEEHWDLDFGNLATDSAIKRLSHGGSCTPLTAGERINTFSASCMAATHYYNTSNSIPKLMRVPQ